MVSLDGGHEDLHYKTRKEKPKVPVDIKAMGRWEEEGEKGKVLISLIAVRRAPELAHRVSVSGEPRAPWNPSGIAILSLAALSLHRPLSCDCREYSIFAM